MEENTKPKVKPKLSADGKAKIIELTPEMEIPAQAGGKIYDLTEALGVSGKRPFVAKSTIADVPDDEQALLLETEEASETNRIEDEIEQEIDSAFATVQSSAEPELDRETSETTPEGKVENLTQMADDALSNASHGLELEPDVDAETTPESISEGEKSQNITLSEEITIDLLAEDAEFAAAKNAEDRDDGVLIDLVDIVETQKQEAPIAKEEDIIDLVDMVTPAQQDAAARADMVGDDEIIDLVDIVKLGGADDVEDDTLSQLDEAALERMLPATDGEDAKTADKGPTFGDQVIQLADILNNSRKKEIPAQDDISLDVDTVLQADAYDATEDVAAGVFGIELDEQSADTSLPPSDREIDEAIERVLRTKYAGDIERLIAAAVEKAVTREIENLRRNLMGDLDEPE